MALNGSREKVPQALETPEISSQEVPGSVAWSSPLYNADLQPYHASVQNFSTTSGTDGLPSNSQQHLLRRFLPNSLYPNMIPPDPNVDFAEERDYHEWYMEASNPKIKQLYQEHHRPEQSNVDTVRTYGTPGAIPSTFSGLATPNPTSLGGEVSSPPLKSAVSHNGQNNGLGNGSFHVLHLDLTGQNRRPKSSMSTQQKNDLAYLRKNGGACPKHKNNKKKCLCRLSTERRKELLNVPVKRRSRLSTRTGVNCSEVPPSLILDMEMDMESIAPSPSISQMQHNLPLRNGDICLELRHVSGNQPLEDLDRVDRLTRYPQFLFPGGFISGMPDRGICEDPGLSVLEDFNLDSISSGFPCLDYRSAPATMASSALGDPRSRFRYRSYEPYLVQS